MELTQEQALIQDTFLEFAQEQLAPQAAEWDAQGLFPRDVIAAMGELGLMGMLVPEVWGGAEADFESYILALMAIAQGDGACSTIMSVQNSVVCLPLLQYGNDMQKEKFLKPLAQGKWLGAFALSESQAGSHALAMTTRAQRQGDDYIINGGKQFITSGKEAQVTLVFAVTDASAGKRGISAFIVPTQTPGYKVAALEKKMGQRASDTAQLIFEDLRIPASHRLGEEGEGYRIALANLESGRIGIAAQAVGMAQAAFQCALNYARERESFGKPIIEHQAVGFRLADMASDLEAARLLVWSAAQRKQRNEPCRLEASRAKCFASEAAERVCRQAIQVLGGYGYLQDFPLERIYRDVRVASIYEGTNDIQRLVMMRELAQG